MKNRIIMMIGIIFLILPFISVSQTIKWEDRMNGDNSIAGLQARGWIVLNEDGGGDSPPWFQGGSYFQSFEGPDTGYVASNFDGANVNGVIDQWLISPALTVAPGDTLYFLARSPRPFGEYFEDSLNIMYSSNAGTTPADFISLGRFLVDTTNWQQFLIAFNSTATMRFAVRYYIFDGGPFGFSSNYIGLDWFQLVTHQSNYPSSISINKSFGFANITQSSSYRMIGLPGNIDMPLSVPGAQKTDWNAFYDNGATTDYLVEYTSGSAIFHFKPGNGFWLLSKNNIALNTQVNTVTLAAGNTYSIPLHSGWNIISNPFERSTNWSAVQFTNLLTVNAVIYDWGGSWTNPSLFSPYKAYYFNNVNNQTSLWIPYDPSGILGKAPDENTLQISGENDIKLSLLLDGEEKSKSFIGFNSESTNDFDHEDYFAPPGDFEETRIAIRNNNLSTAYKYLMKETRNEVGEGQIYNIEVKNLTGKELTLNFNGLANYDAYQVYLVDEKLNNSLKISDDSKFQIPAHVRNTNFKLLIGLQSFIQSNGGNTVPTQFALYQNYPNPFNPTTVIRYSVPKLSKVSIKLFDLLGNEIKTLLNEEKSPGNYELEFSAKGGSASGEDALSLASGVYVYKFQAGSFTQSKKMIMLR